MKILITGGAGFIGTNFITDLLKNDVIENPKENIIVIDDMSQGTFLPGIHDKVNFVYGDIRNDATKNYYKDVDVVYHFAGLVSIYDVDKSRYEAIDINVLGSVNVFEFSKNAGVKKVIYAETAALYENAELPENGYDETEVAPRTIYAASKLMLRNLALSYSRLGELSVTGLRFFNVYGDHQDFSRTVPPAACGFGIRVLQGNRPIIFGDETRRRDFIHVDDIVSFLNIMLNDKIWDETNGEAYNLGTGKSISLIELVNIFYEMTDMENKGFEQQEEINGEAFNIFANIEKAKRLGWEPKISFKQGHASLIETFKRQIASGEIPADYMKGLNIADLKIGK